MAHQDHRDHIDTARPEAWPELMTMAEVGAVLRIGERAVQKWCAAGRIAFVPVGRRRLVRRKSLLRFMERSEVREVRKV